MDENSFRRIKYTFSEDVLRLPLIGTSLVFSVGDEPLPEFRMIERHYFRTKLVKSYDFTFGFCIPGSTNTWDSVYALPPLEDDMIQDMVNSPFETTSDSFYFVGDKLVMHNKASYRYTPEDRSQEKRSYDITYEHKNAGLGGSKGTPGDVAQAKISDGDEEKVRACEDRSCALRGRLYWDVDVHNQYNTFLTSRLSQTADSKNDSDNEGPWSKNSDYD